MNDADTRTSVVAVRLGIRGHLLNIALRTLVKPRLQTMPIEYDAILKTRAEVEHLATKLKAPRDGVVIDEQSSVGGINCERLRLPETGENRILYIHGGAFFCCSPRTHRGITRRLALHSRAEIVCPHYRLIPEHPFPAALDDAMAVYLGLLETTPPERIAVAGDSAGGNLALALLHAVKAANLPMPSCVVTLSPLTDQTGTGNSYRDNVSRDAMLPGGRLRDLAALYLNGAYARLPTASPLFGDFSNFPPMLFHVGDTEILLDDSRLCVARARAAGVETHLRIWLKLPHVFHAFSGHLPVACVALDEISDFISAKMPH